MAASLLLRQGRSGALKAMLLEARVFRGLASTVSLSAESGKSEKGLPPNSKRQSPPKNVVEPKERGKLLATPTAAELSKNLSSPSSCPSVVNQGRMVASPRPSPDDSMLFTDEGVPEFLSRKTLVEFPQKVLPPFRKQGSNSKALQESRGGTDDSSSSSSASSDSSSSSSDSSDSESDEEGSSSKVDTQMTSRGNGGLPKPQASQSLENRAPKIAASAKEKTRSQQGQPDLSPPERPRQAKKKGPTGKLLEHKKDAKPKTTTPELQAEKAFMKQNIKEKQMEKIFRSSEKDRESQKPLEVKKVLPDHTKSGLSTQPAGSPAPVQLSEGTRTAGGLQAPGETGERRLENQVLERDGEVAFPPVDKESSGKQVTGGILKAEEESLEDQVPVQHLKPVPVPTEGIFEEKTAGLELEGKDEMAGEPAPRPEEQDDTQEPVQAAGVAEPFDNSTYRNLQHHEYTPYTFLDLNLDLSKFRMPQPSSGRESPRH
ncbi:NADH dehydrogenase [ubiquinone] flavoprotein 3, mitochondrial isoform X1 [Ailuropoda melanoleuca]|uniref:NADH:ubiquinone oxidoreductase subunit V3 n=1 Tax=Ailuropoda melanoleuca TaxID=9646 RepID=G1L4V0_AILME|nr:NADH dehydrogenase [ubiquinone] flavoprotein 3, mitochondrial isoform X1 [Ailuropoda melanoleuca]